MTQITIQEQLEKATALLNSGMPQEAEVICREVLGNNPDFSPALFLLGLVVQARGHYVESESLLGKAIAIEASNPAYYKSLADTYSATGQAQEAIDAYRKAIELKPDYFQAFANLGNIYLDIQQCQEAVSSYKEALRLRPDIPQLHDNLGNALRMSGILDEAEFCHKKAIEMMPGLASAYLNLGNVYRDQDQLGNAIEAFKKAISLDPNIPEAYLNLANTYCELRDFHQALLYCRTANELPHNYKDARLLEVSLHINLGEMDTAKALLAPYESSRKTDPAVAILFFDLARSENEQKEAIKDLANLSGKGTSSLRRTIQFRLGRFYEQLGDYELAFKHFYAGNDLVDDRLDRDRHLRYIDSIIREFSGGKLKDMAKACNDSELPVFIVGMPRSGKSLTEQLLAGHPQIVGAGELPDITTFAKSVSDKTSHGDWENLSSLLSEDFLNDFADEYIATCSSLARDNTARVINTLPINFYHLGLIWLLFPKARIIHCKRDPLDTCIECYRNEFRNHRTYAFSLDLSDLGFYYRQYQRLMRHWHENTDISILDVQYEDTIFKPWETARRVLDYLGLEDENLYQEFNNSDHLNLVKPLEFRDPISQDFIGSWRHYEKHIAPLFAAL